VPARHTPRHAAPRPQRVRYRGRHRGASTTTRALAVGGVGAGTLATSVLGAPAAHAATSAQWDRVAACESSGNWHADTGNGYYGGLQFTASTWDAYGGQSYAPLASEASPAEQMTVANRVLASQGWGAWPVCSQQAGVAGTPTGGDATIARVRTAGHAPFASSPSGRQHHRRHGATNYTVKPGDSLSKIAAKYDVPGGWHRIYHANRNVIPNPDVIVAGWRLWVHGAGPATHHGAH